jgi:hypothetical protein
MHTREKTFNKLLTITCCDIYRLFQRRTKKTINKVATNNIREAWVKEREEKRTRQVMNAQGVAMRVIQKTNDRIAKAKFVDVWFITTISQVRNWFH